MVCLASSGERTAQHEANGGDDNAPISGSPGYAPSCFGSDQGLVGQFNDVVADDVRSRSPATLPGSQRVWAVGERVHARLADAGLPLVGLFTVPNSVQAITPLVGQVQIESETHRDKDRNAPLWVFHNRPAPGALYEPVSQRLLPLDMQWRQSLAKIRWPTANVPEDLGDGIATLRALIREYLFISLFRACAESLASENASRLAAMERADKNINDLLEQLHGTFHQLRQSGIDKRLRRDFRIRSTGWITLAPAGSAPTSVERSLAHELLARVRVVVVPLGKFLAGRRIDLPALHRYRSRSRRAHRRHGGSRWSRGRERDRSYGHGRWRGAHRHRCRRPQRQLPLKVLAIEGVFEATRQGGIEWAHARAPGR